MRKIVHSLTFAVALMSSANLVACSFVMEAESDNGEIAYVSDIDDLPLPGGFYQNSDETTVYDTAVGRIIEASADGYGSERKLLEFYSETLPQLGWHRNVRLKGGGLDMRFDKDGEELHINIKPQSQSLHMKYDMSGKELGIKAEPEQVKLTIRFSLYPDS